MRKRKYGKWPTTKEEAEKLKGYRKLNMAVAKNNPNEVWMLQKLRQTKWHWARQKSWGYRIFDFWNNLLGVAVEVDGPSHNQQWDEFRDNEAYNYSGIVVLRVRNMNEVDALEVIKAINESNLWWERRRDMGMKFSIPTPYLQGQIDKCHSKHQN